MRHPTLSVAALVVALLLLPASSQAEDAVQPTPRQVDMAICLDTSGSMSGLINAAREKLWKIVEELSMLEPMPDVRITLLTFGSPGNEAAGHVVLQTPLTRDLDQLHDLLFKLRTNGGTEYVGRAVQAAIKELSGSRADLKMIFVAGNESADQDPVAKFREQATLAKERGIALNAIYCGGADDNDASTWRELASIAKGKFANIDHNHGTVRVATPFDAKLTELSSKLNETYVFYGQKREEERARQKKADVDAREMAPSAAADRAAAKAGGLYKVRSDLVESLKRKGFDLAKIADAELPEKLRKMTLEERKAYLAKQAEQRAQIQAKIQELNTQRSKFIREEMKKRKLDDTKAFDRALRDAIREQAKAKGFQVREK